MFMCMCVSLFIHAVAAATGVCCCYKLLLLLLLLLLVGFGAFGKCENEIHANFAGEASSFFTSHCHTANIFSAPPRRTSNKLIFGNQFRFAFNFVQQTYNGVDLYVFFWMWMLK